EIAALGSWQGERPADPAYDAGDPAAPQPGEAVLATWHHLLDDGRLQDHEPHLAGTRPEPRALVSAATAAELGVKPDARVTVTTDRGAITLPVGVADLPERV